MENIPGQYGTAYALYRQLGQSDKLEAQEKLAVYGGEIDCLFGQGKYTDAKNAIIRVMAPYPLPILSYLIVYIKCLIEERKYRQANDAFQLLLHGTESSTLASDPIYPYLQKGAALLKLPTGKNTAVEGYGLNKEELFNIYYAMVKLYEKNGDGAAKRALLSAILEIDPGNRFALKRM
jgi:tetratricopeptide (TPR) repeat protein